MTVVAGVVRFARWKILAVVVAAVGLGVVGWSASSAAQARTDGLLPTVAFLADAYNYPDALAAGAVAGPMGGPVLLTGKDRLDAEAARVLNELRPDLVIIVGGSAALHPQVRTDVEALGLSVRRVSGAVRTATAAALADFAVEMGFERPVVTGVAVTSGMVPGLNAQFVGGRSAEELAGADEQRLADLEAAVAALTGRVKTLESANTELQARLAGVSRQTVEGRDTLRLSGMNLQVVNGTGTTTGTPNGLGNVIIGYNAQDAPVATRSGSHYLVVGDQHEWTSFGGLVAGRGNAATGQWASVSGGTGNIASGHGASVSGGGANTASGLHASVSGGGNNTASDIGSSVSGGSYNTASGGVASVSGGEDNTASGFHASVLGGNAQTVSAHGACHPDCS